MTDQDPRVAHTHAAVARAVIGLLTSEGPAAVTHGRVAETAGVSRATVYRHWADRTSLIVDAVRHQHQAVQLPEPTGDLEHDLRRLLGMVATVMSTSELIPMFVAVLPHLDDDPEVAAVRTELSALREAPVFPVLQRGIDDGDLPADLDLELAAAQLMGTLFGLRFVIGRELDDDLLDAHLEHWLRGHRRP